MRRYLSNRTVAAGAAIGIALSACNEILDNEDRKSVV